MIELFKDPVMYPEYVVVVRNDCTIALTWVKINEDTKILRFINSIEDVSFNDFVKAFNIRVNEFLNKNDDSSEIEIDLNISER